MVYDGFSLKTKLRRELHEESPDLHEPTISMHVCACVCMCEGLHLVDVEGRGPEVLCATALHTATTTRQIVRSPHTLATHIAGLIRSTLVAARLGYAYIAVYCGL